MKNHYLAGSYAERGNPVQTLMRRLALALLLIAGGTVALLSLLNLRGLTASQPQASTLAQAAQAAPAQANAAQLTGNYSGMIDLGVTLGGILSDTLATPPAPAPPDLGSVDLSLQLTQTGSAVSGYVRLDKTLVFSVAHTLGSGASSLKIGPYLSGSFDGTNLKLQSEQVSIAVSGRTVLRQFRLTGKSTSTDGSQIKGEYRETLWGYATVPLTVIGNFTLQRPVYDDNAPTTSNQVPLTTADNANTTPGKAVTINVLGNDSDPNQDALTITSLSKPQFGTAKISGQSVVYTPNSNFTGVDTFSYFVSDGKGGNSVGSVTVAVGNGGNATPTATTVPGSTATATPSNTATPIPGSTATPIPGAKVYLPVVTR
ncbi:MAG: Ig-like domain-containing protein [Caldilineaceae bacterium]